LIEQNAEKMRQHWPGAPMGIYSAGLGQRTLGEPITFGGIQSLRTKASQIGHIDLCLIDECHLVNHKNEGGYRTLLAALMAINPAMRVVGLTATPYRLGHGLITDEPALFHDLLEPVTIEELVADGFLSTLRSKVTQSKLDVSGVHKRGGEYIESELQAAVDTDENNQNVVQEVIRLAGDRRSWLFFCAGVDHAKHVCAELLQSGISAACVTGETPKGERERILTEYKAGRIRALTNANVLTTGFDAPNIDLIAMLRPTMSPGLYVQMAGRGLRLKDHTDHCLVLDFAGVVQKHGPITAVQIPDKAGSGEAPTKACPKCEEIVHASAKQCPECGHWFTAPEQEQEREQTLRLRANDDIMGLAPSALEVTNWKWRKHVSRASGKEMLAVTYYGQLSDPSVTEYLTVTHDGYAGEKALNMLAQMVARSGAVLASDDDLEQAASALNAGAPPSEVQYRRDGKFFRVLKREWN
jgi:DNA repair protein RadD